MAKKDVLAVLPTGSGKSLCYQLPALLNPGTTLVISPLIALMIDQVEALKGMGIPAAALNSQCSPTEARQIMSEFSSYKLIYLAPERLMMPSFLDFLSRQTIANFVIDEAHCISQWGHAFRLEYRQLSILKATFPLIPIAAFTATATPQIRSDIITQLHLKTPFELTANFDRPNLTLAIRERQEAKTQLLDYLKAHPNESGIIYSTTRKEVDKWHQFLLQKGVKAGKYHAGLSDYERMKAQTDFLHDRIDIIVATVAFGMGVNKPNVRFVMHMDMPKSVEGYYQEIGRAGRDTLPATCLMLYKTQDYLLQKRMVADLTDPVVKQSQLRRLEQFFAFCHSSTCRRKEILQYFGQKFEKENCGNCDNCVDEITLEDATITAQKILSCVFRMQQRFGINLVIDVLKGAETQAITQNRFDQLSTYGLLKEFSKLEIRHYIFSLINQNHLFITEGDYPILKLGKSSAGVLKGHTQVFIRHRKISEKAEKKAKTVTGQLNTPLFLKLKQKRAEIAKAKNVPPYIIFHDKHLQAMAEIRPQTPEQFAEVPGVGAQKLQMYALDFLEVLAH